MSADRSRATAHPPHLFAQDFDPARAELAHDRIRPGLAALAMALAVALASVTLAVLGGRHQPHVVTATGLRLTASETRGRQLFGAVCSRCHTLAAAGAAGRVGPNLDHVAPYGLDPSFVHDTIQAGMVRGNGNMPPGLYDGQDADDVAAFVAAVTRDEAAARQARAGPGRPGRR